MMGPPNDPLQATRNSDILPPSGPDQVFVTLSALEAGWIHLPEREFIEPHDPNGIHRCPSLAFYIYHPPSKTRIVYDLGLRRDVQNYPPKVAKQFIDGTRTVEIPVDVSESLENGGIAAGEINLVILSHLHYDHTGDPTRFPQSQFIVGPGSLALIDEGDAGDVNETWYLPSLLPQRKRITELPGVETGKWKSLGLFPAALDYFGDGSFYIINAPGHVEGHINGLARIGRDRFVLLGSDSCHFASLLDGSCCIARFARPDGSIRSVHVDDSLAKQHIQRMREMKEIAGEKLEIVLAHDLEWCRSNSDKFLPGKFRG